MSEIVVALRDVWKYYTIESRPVAVLRGVSATIKRGEIVGIHGPSGAGKTTLLKIMAGLEKPDRGEVVVDGYLLTALDDKALATLRNTVIGFVPQDAGLIEELTVFENIELPLLIAGVDKEERRKRVEELIEYIGLRGREKALPKYLSGGERQRVAIARALANTPSVILADEPTANLDWANAKRVLQLFDRIRRDFGTTIVIVTHDPRVLEFTDRKFLLEDGLLREIPGL
ncbi:MAG: ABC transporter ATP-binding protein [Crenarchaeota archaeon]|nr:ABC transporter ATP-binding protein [Thermoproteota archaeon]